MSRICTYVDAFQRLAQTLCLFAGLFLLMTFAQGCTTYDSDMPWGRPESWEGSPAIPGLSGQGY